MKIITDDRLYSKQVPILFHYINYDKNMMSSLNHRRVHINNHYLRNGRTFKKSLKRLYTKDVIIDADDMSEKDRDNYELIDTRYERANKKDEDYEKAYLVLLRIGEKIFEYHKKEKTGWNPKTRYIFTQKEIVPEAHKTKRLSERHKMILIKLDVIDKIVFSCNRLEIMHHDVFSYIYNFYYAVKNHISYFEAWNRKR